MSFELGFVMKSSMLLLVAAVLAGVFRNSSASKRYSIWAAGLLSVLIFPIMSSVLPEIPLRVLPRATVPTALPAALRPDAAAGTAETGANTMGPQSTLSTANAVRSFPKRWLLVGWGAGAVLVLVRYVLGIRDVRRLKATSTNTADADWHERLVRLKRELGVASAVDLRIGCGAIPPMTWGIRRHTILFPTAAVEWTAARVDHVMLHELAHVKRRDGLMQLFAQAACAIHWFSPLVWHAAYRLRIERERACDDLVLKLGASPEDYAGHLLQIARDVNAGLSPATISMTQIAGFEKRLRLILDSTRNRQTLSRRSTVLLTFIAAILTALTATGHLAARSTQVSTPKWAGAWKLNKERSAFPQDVRVLEMVSTIETATLKLEPVQGGIKYSSEIVAGRLSHRQYIDTTLPLGDPFDFKDVSPFSAGAASLPDATVLITPLGDDALQMDFNYQLGGRTVARYEVSPDGKVLTISISDFGHVVFDRR
jgi:beta-lactamase regulating signal transducer with metallopeptidase domain